MAKRATTPRVKTAAAQRSAAKATADGRTVDNRPVWTGHLIVGIGASAGGLAAFQSFFSEMPADSGMAFVLVQHLNPDHGSALAEILGRFTAMPVIRAVDGTVPVPNTVTVMPENSILSIEGGVLHLMLPETSADRYSAIDHFLVSLANDQAENAVGVILSGFGSDGSIGIKAIKEAGGLTLSEADFDHRAKLGMPESATITGFVDHVLQAEEMPKRLLEYRNFRAEAGAKDLSGRSGTGQAKHLMTICSLLKSRTGRDFSEYKPNSLSRRIHRRMEVLRASNLQLYIDMLRTIPGEPERLVQEILVGVTRFFRDTDPFEDLAKTALARLIARGDPESPLRIWVAGCATGEEAYSLAILFKEALAKAKSPRKVTIFATDIDDRAITFARAGVYGTPIEADITAARLAKHFSKEGQRYRVEKPIRDMCVFATHDLANDPPFSRLDMVSCRNLLIYFKPTLQQRVIATFHYALAPDGLLWLGPSETLGTQTRLFRTLEKRSRVFWRQNDVAATPRAPSSFPMTKARSTTADPGASAADIDAQATRMVLQYEPSYIVLDSQHEILRFSGPIAKFMEPVSGDASLNIFRMLHTQLRGPIRALVRQAFEFQRSFQDHVAFQASGQVHAVNLIVQPMAEQVGGERLLLVIFQELASRVSTDHSPPEPLKGSGDADTDRGELISARTTLQRVTRELETAREESQSTVEEFQSITEELHSTVEELETSKEELQSVNEELQTVNAELNDRAGMLARSNSDLANLFDSTSVATLFLDNQLRIRRFTPAITKIFNVRLGDEGRPISDFTCRVRNTFMVDDFNLAQHDLSTSEREVEAEDSSATYLQSVKPYRDLKNVIDGVVVTFVDITERKQLERDRAHLAAIVSSSQEAIISHDLDGKVTSWNAGAETIYGYTAQEAIGLSIAKLLQEGQINKWPSNLRRLQSGEQIEDIVASRVTKDGRVINVSLTISAMRDISGEIIGASAIARDVSQRVASDLARFRKLEEEAEVSLVAKSQFLANMSHEIRTPLTGVLGFAGLLEALPDLPDAARSYANRITTSGETLLAVVNDILDFSKLEAGSVVLDPHAFDPRVFFAETIELVSVQAGQKGLKLTTAFDGPLPAAVLADSARVRQVLLNLLSNAIKFTEAGQIRVTLRYQPEAGGALRFAVTDSGIGIPADQFDRLFRRFSQVDGSNTRQFGGAGLGLAICKALTELMGGQIGAESREGEGSTFWFTIAAPPAARVQPEPVASDPVVAAARTRLLVVDDVAMNRDLVGHMLLPYGYDITEASGGPEAVKKATAKQFDLILMDLQMPGMDGLAATRAIRANCELNRLTPILAVSANVLSKHRAECFSAGMNDHIAKPIIVMDLLTKIARWTNPPGEEPTVPTGNPTVPSG